MHSCMCFNSKCMCQTTPPGSAGRQECERSWDLVEFASKQVSFTKSVTLATDLGFKLALLLSVNCFCFLEQVRGKAGGWKTETNSTVQISLGTPSFLCISLPRSETFLLLWKWSWEIVLRVFWRSFNVLLCGGVCGAFSHNSSPPLVLSNHEKDTRSKLCYQ